MTIHEFPYRNSPFAHLCYLVSEALRGPTLSRDEPAATSVRTPWLDRIDQWVWKGALKRRDAWLSQSTDLADLESRLRVLDRDTGTRRYY